MFNNFVDQLGLSFVGIEDFQDHVVTSLRNLYIYFESDFIGREMVRVFWTVLEVGKKSTWKSSYIGDECSSSKVWKKRWTAGASSLLFHSAAKFYFHFIFLSRSISLFLSSRYVTDPINKVASLVFQAIQTRYMIKSRGNMFLCYRPFSSSDSLLLLTSLKGKVFG